MKNSQQILDILNICHQQSTISSRTNSAIPIIAYDIVAMYPSIKQDELLTNVSTMVAHLLVSSLLVAPLDSTFETFAV